MRIERSSVPALRRAGTLFCVWVVLSTLLAVAPASADPVPVMECTAYGWVSVRPATPEENFYDRYPTTHWEIAAEGECFGGGEGPWHVDVSGTGSSLWYTLGLCPGSLDLLLQSWRVRTTLELESSRPFGLERTREQLWRAPVDTFLTIPGTLTTFPVATPFRIEEEREPVGGGSMFTKLFAQCPASSDRAGGERWHATFLWTMLA